MRRRRPPFALVLAAVLALAALAIVLLGGNGPSARGSGTGPVQSVPGGRERACLTTHAQANVTLRKTLSATGTATAPLRVVQKVRAGRSVVTVTRTASFTAKVGATRVVGVRQVSVGTGHACATASSVAAARGLAIRRAYAIAMRAAHSHAAAGASNGLQREVKRVYPSLVSEAHSQAEQRAQAQAAAARPALAITAHARAVRLAQTSH